MTITDFAHRPATAASATATICADQARPGQIITVFAGAERLVVLHIRVSEPDHINPNDSVMALRVIGLGRETLATEIFLPAHRQIEVELTQR